MIWIRQSGRRGCCRACRYKLPFWTTQLLFRCRTAPFAPPESPHRSRRTPQVPPQCIPIHANVTQYDWTTLAGACQFDVIMMDPPWQARTRTRTHGHTRESVLRALLSYCTLLSVRKWSACPFCAHVRAPPDGSVLPPVSVPCPQLATANPTRGVSLGYSQLSDQHIAQLPLHTCAAPFASYFRFSLKQPAFPPHPHPHPHQFPQSQLTHLPTRIPVHLPTRLPSLQKNGFLFVWVINAKYQWTLQQFKKWGYRWGKTSFQIYHFP